MIDYNKDYFLNYYTKKLERLELSDVKKVCNWFWGWFRYLNKFVDLKNGNQKKVLEIGCAIGGFSSILQKHNFDVHASDFSEYALEHAKRLWPKMKFYQVDVAQDISIDEKFHFIFSFEVLEHLENPEKALQNMYNKLKPDGVLICSTPPPYEKFMNVTGHVNVLRAEEWHKLLERAGFSKESIKIKQVAFLPFFHRYSQFLSRAIPIKMNLPYFNSTYFLIAEK